MTAYRSKADRWAGRRGVNEEFDFSGMSDTDYTDYFADMDQDAEDEAAFTAGLRKALRILVCKPNGANDWVKGADPRLDPLFAGAVSGSAADGWRVSFSATALKRGGTGLKPASSSFGHLYGNAFPAGGPVMDVVLNLKAVSAAWLKSARWRLEPGPGVTKYELYILPGKRDGSLAGSPEYVAGDVIAGMYWWIANIMGVGDFRPSFPPVCRSIAGAPKEITGSFECMIDPDEFKRGPGFLNGAPLTVGGKYFTVTFPPDDPPEEDGRSRLVGSFLWDGGGNIIPAFTDGMSRRYGGSIKVNILHPAPGSGRRRKTDLCIGGGVRGKELSGLMFPNAKFTCVFVPVRGDLDECINWLCEVNGVGGVIR